MIAMIAKQGLPQFIAAAGLAVALSLTLATPTAAAEDSPRDAVELRLRLLKAGALRVAEAPALGIRQLSLDYSADAAEQPKDLRSRLQLSGSSAAAIQIQLPYAKP